VKTEPAAATSTHSAESGRVNRPQLLGLTGLRFCAAMLVVVYHFGLPGNLPLLPQRLIAIGNTAVSLFFILSGFVMAYTYADTDGGRYRGAVAFWIARFARIYPAYLLSLLLLAPTFFAGIRTATPTQNMNTFVDAVAALTLTQSWGNPDTASVWNFPAWSLSIEAFFYLAFPLLRQWVRNISTPRLLGAIVLVIGISNAITGAYVVLDPDRLGVVMTPLNASITIVKTPWLALLAFNPLVRLPQFVVGLLAGRLFLARPWPARLGAWLEGAGIASLTLVTLLSPRLPEAMLLQGILDPCFLLLIFGIACGGGPLRLLLSTRPMVVLGEASYGIYILQAPVFRRLGSFVHPAIAVIPVAVAVFFLIERPLRRLIVRTLSPASSRPVLSVPAGVPPRSAFFDSQMSG
jgi:peptidoglycan/LPS O-acetylase OafA/YrhL